MSADRPIAVGDLVVVVRKCCPQDLGLVFRVAGFSQRSNLFHCTDCGAHIGAVNTAVVEGKNWRFPLAWLKRIPPLSELEGVSEDARITTKLPVKENA